MKARQGKPIIAYGGASFARSLVAHGLVDQYALRVHPVAKEVDLGSAAKAHYIQSSRGGLSNDRGSWAQENLVESRQKCAETSALH